MRHDPGIREVIARLGLFVIGCLIVCHRPACPGDPEKMIILINGSVRSYFFATAGNVAPKITPDAGNNQDENETI